MILRLCDLDEFVIRMRNKKVVCFGAGGWLEAISREFASYKIEKYFSYVVDNNEALWGKEKEVYETRLHIHAPSYLYDNANQDTVILITSGYFTQIYAQLEEQPSLKYIECYIAQNIYFFHSEKLIFNAVSAPKGFRVNAEIEIPKIIHYCWFSGDPIPEKNLKCIESWRKYCPDYEIIEWNQSNYDLSAHPYMNQAAQNRRWGFAGDYARLDIVYNHGGIYMDVDVEVIKNLDELLYNNAYACFENFKLVNLGSGFGAVAKFPLIKELRDKYDSEVFTDDPTTFGLVASPVHQTEVLTRHGLKVGGSFQIVNGMTIYPVEYLCAKSAQTRRILITDNTYSIHDYEASWISSDRASVVNEAHRLIKVALENEGITSMVIDRRSK